MDDNTIINVHTHTFTYHSLPAGFLPFGLNRIIRLRFVQRFVLWVLRTLNPLSNIDLFDRLARFAKAALKENQCEVFEQLLSYYPDNSAFVVLPMDMDFMNRAHMPHTIEAQHDELLAMLQQEKYAKALLPFVHFDPRRNNALELITRYIDAGFKGIKLYPNLGYDPNDAMLKPIWSFANERALPVMVHCSRGGVSAKGSLKHDRWRWSQPENYKSILKSYPNMHLCFGHFGGNQDWENYLNTNAKESSWLKSILDMMRERDETTQEKLYPNLYADISYSVFNFKQNVPILKVLLTDDMVRSHTLFGSDFYMAEQEKFNEKHLSMFLRAELGEPLFWQIANTNPRAYLQLH